LWNVNNLIDGNFNYLGENARRVWKEDWNCVSDAPPIELDGEPGDGSFGAHW